MFTRKSLLLFDPRKYALNLNEPIKVGFVNDIDVVVQIALLLVHPGFEIEADLAEFERAQVAALVFNPHFDKLVDLLFEDELRIVSD